MMIVINSFQIPCLWRELEREASSILLLPLTCEATNTPGKERKHFYAPVLFVLFYKKMGIHQKRYYKWTELGCTFAKLFKTQNFVFFRMNCQVFLQPHSVTEKNEKIVDRWMSFDDLEKCLP